MPPSLARSGIALASVLFVASCYSPEEEERPILDYVIGFEGQSVALDAQAVGLLDRAAAAARRDGGQRVSVEGYADPAANPEANQILSRLRAQAVADALAGRGVRKTDIAIRPRSAIGGDPGVESRRVEVIVGR